MHKADVRAALHHFVRGDRGIESAGEQADKLAGGVWRQTARSGNAPGVNQERAARDLNAASKLRRFKINTDIAAGGVQFVVEIAADFTLETHGVQRKIFVAASGAHGEGGKLLGADFLPSGFAKRRKRVSA